MSHAAVLGGARPAQNGKGGPRFAVVLAVGQRPVELCRALALIESLVWWEPAVGWLVIVDDADSSRCLSDVKLIPQTCQAVTLINPRRTRMHDACGGLFRGLSAALAWIHANTSADFVLKIDTDALVIGPFAKEVRLIMESDHEAGVIGAIGTSCNPHVKVIENRRQESLLLLAERLLPSGTLRVDEQTAHRLNAIQFGHVSAEKVEAIDRIRPHLAAAVRRGYATDDYCQGGAYVVTRTMIERLAAMDYLEQADAWEPLSFSEDRIMAMYARAVDMHIVEHAGSVQPFGVQFRALPYPLEELIPRGYRIIHSVKNDPRYDEETIGAYFQQARLVDCTNQS